MQPGDAKDVAEWMTLALRSKRVLRLDAVFEYLKERHGGAGITRGIYGEEELSEAVRASFAGSARDALWIPRRRAWRLRKPKERDTLDEVEIRRRLGRLEACLREVRDLEILQDEKWKPTNGLVESEDEIRDKRLRSIRMTVQLINSLALDISFYAAAVGVPIEPDRASSKIALTAARLSMASSRYTWMLQGAPKPRSIRAPMPGDGSRPTLLRWFRGLHNRDRAVLGALVSAGTVAIFWMIQAYGDYRVRTQPNTPSPIQTSSMATTTAPVIQNCSTDASAQ